MDLTPETYVYKTVEQCEIKADVYRTVSSATLIPVIVYIHGGALIYGSRVDINKTQVECYVNAGYTIVSIDYRLAPESKLPDIIEDLEDVFKWIRKEGPRLFHADPNRIATIGHSGGGYLALMSGTCVDPPPQAIVSFYGYGDIVGDWYIQPSPVYLKEPLVSEEEAGCLINGPVISEPYAGRNKDRYYLYLRQKGLWPLGVSGHDPAKEPEFFVPYCPLGNVNGQYPPTLLIHGDRDDDVPYEQSVLMAEALKNNKVSHELITMQGLGHGFDVRMEDQRVKDVFEREKKFLDRYLIG